MERGNGTSCLIHSAFGDTPHVVAFVDVDPSLSLTKNLSMVIVGQTT